MKVIKTAALVVGAVALVASGVGAIGGVAALGAIGLGGVSLATITAVGTIAGLVGTVANAISPPKAAKGTVGGSQTDFKLDPNAGIPYLIGRSFAGGNIVHRDTWGTDNQYQGFVVSYSGAGTLQSFESVLVDQNNYGRAGDSVGGTYNGWLWNRLTLPGTPAGPITSPVAGFPGLDDTFRLSGHATGVIVLKFDVKNGKKFSNGVPKQGVVAVGERVYDPRQDSTWPGGNGPCRVLDESTYAGGNAALNPWLHALTWALGRWQNGKRVMGVGQKVRSIDVQSFVDAANIAEANGWTIGGQVYSIDNKWDVLRQMAQAGGGQCMRLGARLSCVINSPKVALTTVNETDLVGKGSVSASQTYRDRLNGMVPKYRSEAHGWEIVPASVVRVASYVQADGEEKTREWPLPLVQGLKQASELTAYELVNRREFGPITLPLFIRFMGYKPGDALNLNVGPLGLVNQMAIVRKRQIDPTSGNVQLAFVSETPAKHAFALGHTSVAPPIPDLSVPDESVVSPPQASDWAAVGGVLEKDGVTTPAIVLSGDVRNPMAEAFLVELRPAGAADWASVGQYPAKTTRVDIVTVAAGASYFVGVSFIRRGVIGERLQLDLVTVGPAIADASQSLPGSGTIGGTLDPVTGKPIGGIQVADALAQLDRIVPIEADLDDIKSDISAIELAKVGTDAALAALSGVNADQDAVLRQAERDSGVLSEAVMRLVSESDRTRRVLRDAGVIVDPVTGMVRIYAVDQLADRTSKAEITLDGQKAVIASKASVDYVAEQIALAILDPDQAAQLEPIIVRLSSAETKIDGLNASILLKASLVEVTAVRGRVSTVEQNLDAVTGTISSKAEQTEVTEQGIRLGSVEQTLTTIGDVSGITTTIRQARLAADNAGAAALAGLIAANSADTRQILAQAEIRQELYTKINDGLSAEATARTTLSVRVGDLDSRSVQETTARITADGVLGRRIDALSVTSGDQAAAIATATEAAIKAGAGVAGVTTTIRQQTRDQDQTAEGLLAALIAGEQTGQRQAAQIVQITTELRTDLVANESASAIARQALLARLGLAEAAIVTTSKVLADTTQSLTSRIQAAEAVFNDATTGLAATRARLIVEEEARARADEASARAISLIDAALNDPVTGLPATRATVGQTQEALARGDEANAQATEQVRVAQGLTAEGLATTQATVDQDRQARIDGDAINARATDLVAAVVNNPETGLDATRGSVATDRQARIDGDGVNARAVQQVAARLDGFGGTGVTVEQAVSATVDRLGKVEGRYTITIDANGNLSGFQLIGSDEGPASFNLINTDLKMGTGRVVFNDGTYMQVQGVAFGEAKNLLEWFGPTMPLDQCSTANAVSYKTTRGDAYFGGSLSAGLLKNSGSSSDLGANAVCEVGPFGSNGGQVRYVASWLYRTADRAVYPATTQGLQNYKQAAASYGLAGDGVNDFGTKTTEYPNSIINLSRALSGGAFTQLDQRGFTTLNQSFNGEPPTVGDAPGYADLSSTIGGGITANDPVLQATDRTVRLTLARGFTLGSANLVQRLTIVSTEG